MQQRHRLLLGTATTAALFVTTLIGFDSARGQDAGGSARPAPSASRPTKKPTVTENIKMLGQELTDPNTPKRIKAHEQEVEDRIERTRDQQRKDHGKAKPGDMVDVVKKLDGADAGTPKGTVTKPGTPSTDTRTEVKTVTKTEKKTTVTNTKPSTATGTGGAPR